MERKVPRTYGFCLSMDGKFSICLALSPPCSVSPFQRSIFQYPEFMMVRESGLVGQPRER